MSRGESNGSSDDEGNEQIEYLPNQIVVDQYFDCPKAQAVLSTNYVGPQQKRTQGNLDQFLKSLIICHHAHTSQKSQREQGSRSIFKSLYKEEEAQLQFADSFDYSLVLRKGKHITINRRGTQEKFEELISRRIQFGNDYMTIQAVKPSWNALKSTPT